MLSSVLQSRRAILVNIEIMRTFVRLRGLLASNEALAQKLDALEKNYDAQFKVVFDALRKLMASPASQGRAAGFRPRVVMPAGRHLRSQIATSSRSSSRNLPLR